MRAWTDQAARVYGLYRGVNDAIAEATEKWTDAVRLAIARPALKGVQDGLFHFRPWTAGDSPNYIEKQLKAFRSGERKQEQMSIIAKGLEDQDIRDVAKWLLKPPRES